MAKRKARGLVPIEEIVVAIMADIRAGADPEHLQRFVERGLADPDAAVALPEAMRRLGLEFAPPALVDPYEETSLPALHSGDYGRSGGVMARVVVCRGTPMERVLAGLTGGAQ